MRRIFKSADKHSRHKENPSPEIDESEEHPDKECKQGKRFIICGSFKDKESAKKKESEHPGSFIKETERKGKKYFTVMKPK